MTRFGFVVHPISAKDAGKKYPIAKILPDRAIEAMLSRKPSVLASRITGVESKTGATTEGVFVGVPMTPSMMLRAPEEAVYQKILDAVSIAADEGAEIVGLGAFTAVVGDKGVTVAERSPVPITTGNSYTVATAIQGTLQACERVGMDLSQCKLGVVGATGSIGKTCAQVMAPKFREVVVIGRDPERTEEVAATMSNAVAAVDVSPLSDCDAIVTVTSSDTSVIQPRDLKPGSVVCDVARPRDVSGKVAKERPDVLVIEGGVVRVPGSVEFGMDFGFPPRTAYACMSETMLLALENRKENYTVGKDVSPQQVEETLAWAEKHGFELEGYRSFEKAVSEEIIERVRSARGDRVAVG